MANNKNSGIPEATAPAVRVLNLQESRAAKALNSPVIIAPNGEKFSVWGIPLDGFLAIYSLRETMASSRDAATVQEALLLVKEEIGKILPGFPLGELDLDEIMQVINFLQTAIGPQSGGDTGGSDDKPGE